MVGISALVLLLKLYEGQILRGSRCELSTINIGSVFVKVANQMLSIVYSRGYGHWITEFDM